MDPGKMLEGTRFQDPEPVDYNHVVWKVRHQLSVSPAAFCLAT
jgi:hypothetical protein